VILTLSSLVALAASPEIELVRPGAEPRRPLRLTPEEGLVERAQLELRVTARSQSSAGKMPAGDLPQLDMELQTEVTGTGDRIRYRVEVTDAKAASTGNEELDPVLAQAMAQLVGLTGQAEVDSLGRRLSEDWSASPDADPQLVEELRKCVSFALPRLPEEPVGIGAEWTVTRPTDDQGFQVTQVETWTMEGRDPRGVTLHTHISQRAADGQPVTAGLPEGTTATLHDHLAIGEGAYVLDDGHLLPRSAVEGMTVKFELLLDREGTKDVVDSIVGHELALTRSPAP